MLHTAVRRRSCGIRVSNPHACTFGRCAIDSVTATDFLHLPDHRVRPRSFTKPLLGDAAVPNTNRPLPIRCPKCRHSWSKLVVKSLTVMTVTCTACKHTWETELKGLPLEIQERVHAVVRDDYAMHGE